MLFGYYNLILKESVLIYPIKYIINFNFIFFSASAHFPKTYVQLCFRGFKMFYTTTSCSAN